MSRLIKANYHTNTKKLYKKSVVCFSFCPFDLFVDSSVINGGDDAEVRYHVAGKGLLVGEATGGEPVCEVATGQARTLRALVGGLADAAAEAEVGFVVDLVSQIRSARSETNVPAAAQIPLVMVGAASEVRARVEAWRDTLLRLARLSDITFAGGDVVYIIERDNQIGANAAIKRLYSVPLADLEPVALTEDLPLVTKTMVYDFIPDLQALNGFVVDKIEGFTIDADGNAFAATDNDGVDDSSGETLFFKVEMDM